MGKESAIWQLWREGHSRDSRFKDPEAETMQDVYMEGKDLCITCKGKGGMR